MTNITNTNEAIFTEAQIEQLHKLVSYMNSVPEEIKAKAYKSMEQLGYETEFFHYFSLHFVNYETGHHITFLTYEDAIEWANNELNPTEPEQLTDRVFVVGDLLWDGLGEEVHYEVISRTDKTVTIREHMWDDLTASSHLTDHEYPITLDDNRNERVVIYTNDYFGDTYLTATSEKPTTEATDAQIATDTTEAQPTAEPTTASEEEAVVEEKKEEPKQKGKGKAYFRFWYTYHTGFRRETEKAIALSYDEGNGHEGLRWIPKSIILWGPVNSCGNQFFYVPKWFFFRNHYEIGRFECDGEVFASELTDHDIGGESYVDYNGEEVVVFENDGNIKPEGRVIDTIDGYEICRKTYNLDVFARKI